MSAAPNPGFTKASVGISAGLCVVAVVMLSAPPRPADGGQVVCPVVADNSIASYPSEVGQNSGRSRQLKIKGRENQVILKFDLSAIPPKASVTKAVLSVKLHAPEYRINQIGYSTVPTDWVEGTGKNNDPNGSCHKWPGGKGRSWGDPGWVILDVIHGNGGNVTGWALARKVGERFEIDLPGRVIEAMRADQPGGLILMDESGWWGGALANIYILSRESREGPILTVTYDGQDEQAPSAPKIAAVPADLDDGQMLVEITCGGDDGEKGLALGFDVRVLKGAVLTAENWAKADPVPRYRIPRPQAPGRKLRLWLYGLEPGASYSVGVVAYDESGNRSAVAATGLVKATGPTPPPRLALGPIDVSKGGPLDVGKALRVWAVDELTKVDPVSGKVLVGSRYVDADARAGNHVWNGKDRKIVLSAARNEIVACRVVLELAREEGFRGLEVTDGTATPSPTSARRTQAEWTSPPRTSASTASGSRPCCWRSWCPRTPRPGPTPGRSTSRPARWPGRFPSP